MKANTQMNEHRAEGRISIHHLLGKICIHLPDQEISLAAGQLLVLDCGMVHDCRSTGRASLPAHFGNANVARTANFARSYLLIPHPAVEGVPGNAAGEMGW
jgi:hypothetical protein